MADVIIDYLELRWHEPRKELIKVPSATHPAAAHSACSLPLPHQLCPVGYVLGHASASAMAFCLPRELASRHTEPAWPPFSSL